MPRAHSHPGDADAPSRHLSGGPPPPDPDQAVARHRAALRELFPLPGGPDEPPPATGAQAGRKRRRIVALGAVAALGLGLLAWEDPAWRTETHATSAGKRQELTLTDGSRITLDSGTRVTVTRHWRSRRVTLESGRALFSVVPSWRPFTVDAGAAQVRVVGTAFDIRRRQDAVTVTVRHGRVAVQGTQASSALVLTADQQVEVRGGHPGEPAAVDAAAATAWQDGRFVFRRTPLREVLDDIAHYSGRTVRLADPALADLQVSGVYRIANAAALLDLLPTLLPVQVAHGNDGVSTVSAR